MAARRIWSAAEKQRILDEASAEGMNVSAVARRNGVAQSLLYRWRTDAAAANRKTPAFVTVALAAPATPRAYRANPSCVSSAPPKSGRNCIEIVLANGRSLLVPADVDTEALVRIIDALEAKT